MIKEYTIGDVYYRLSFLDNEYKYPVIHSLVFLGKNLDNDLVDDLWFFQDAESYIYSGVYGSRERDVAEELRGSNRVIVQVFDFPETQLDDVLTKKELINELEKYREL